MMRTLFQWKAAHTRSTIATTQLEATQERKKQSHDRCRLPKTLSKRLMKVVGQREVAPSKSSLFSHRAILSFVSRLATLSDFSNRNHTPASRAVHPRNRDGTSFISRRSPGEQGQRGDHRSASSSHHRLPSTALARYFLPNRSSSSRSFFTDMLSKTHESMNAFRSTPASEYW